jgi:hypothetical protein
MTQRLSKEDLFRALSQHFYIPHELLGGSARSGFVQRMEWEKRIQFNKISRPSKYMINKYGTAAAIVHDDTPADYGHDDGPLFDDIENVDYHVGKQKPKRVAAKRRGPTEVEEERLQQAQREQREAKQKQLDELDQLKKLVVDCQGLLRKEDNTYRDVIDELQHRRGMKKVAKNELQEQIVVKHHANIKKIKQQYSMVYQYVKKHKLNETDLNHVHKHIRQLITKSQ